jgi:hypothetical protein
MLMMLKHHSMMRMMIKKLFIYTEMTISPMLVNIRLIFLMTLMMSLPQYQHNSLNRFNPDEVKD